MDICLATIIFLSSSIYLLLQKQKFPYKKTNSSAKFSSSGSNLAKNKVLAAERTMYRYGGFNDKGN